MLPCAERGTLTANSSAELGDVMRLLWLALILVGWTVNSSVAGPLEDGLAAASKGDFATALELWKPLAEQGNADAQYNLGLLYENGSGVSRNSNEAMRWYGKAAAQGNILARAKLDLAYEAARKAQEERKALAAQAAEEEEARRRAAEKQKADELAQRHQNADTPILLVPDRREWAVERPQVEAQRKADELKRQEEQRKAEEAKRHAMAAAEEERRKAEELRKRKADEDGKRSAEAAENALGLSLLTRLHIQVALKAKGFDSGLPDGSFGARTRKMIEEWQRANGHSATGYVTKEQVDRLLQEASVEIQKFDDEARRRALLRQQQQELRQREGGAAEEPPMQVPAPPPAPPPRIKLNLQ